MVFCPISSRDSVYLTGINNEEYKEVKMIQNKDAQSWLSYKYGKKVKIHQVHYNFCNDDLTFAKVEGVKQARIQYKYVIRGSETIHESIARTLTI